MITMNWGAEIQDRERLLSKECFDRARSERNSTPNARRRPLVHLRGGKTAVQAKGKEKVRDTLHGRDWYISRALAFIILLNGVAALILVTALAFVPQSTTDPHRLAWAMMVFGSGAITGLLSSLLAYFGRTVVGEMPSRVIMRDLLRVGAIVAAVGSGAAFLMGLNMVVLTVPESSSTRPRTKSQAPNASPARNPGRLILLQLELQAGNNRPA
jgi:hypothetical protein